MSKPRYPTCIFCRRSDSEPSKEDVLAKWIAREGPAGALSSFNVKVTKTQLSPERRYKTRGHLGVISQTPCKRCNNGWMSDLENKAKPAMRPLIRGIASTLTTDQQLTIARWKVKTAILYEFVRERSPRFFKPLDRKELFEAQLLPSNTLVYLARFEGTLWGRTLGDSDLQFELSKPVGTLVDAYTTTFAIGKLALQLLCVRKAQGATGRIWVHLPGYWRDYHLQVWPATDTVNWPPPKALDDTGLERFGSRWHDIGK